MEPDSPIFPHKGKTTNITPPPLLLPTGVNRKPTKNNKNSHTTSTQEIPLPPPLLNDTPPLSKKDQAQTPPETLQPPVRLSQRPPAPLAAEQHKETQDAPTGQKEKTFTDIIQQPESTRTTTQPPKKHWFRKIYPWAIAIIAPALFVTTFVSTGHIPSASMESTIQVGANIYGFKNLPKNIHNQDIIIFNNENTTWGPGLYVKRVIGKEGDHITYTVGEPHIKVNGKDLIEPYLDKGTEPSLIDIDETVPDGTVFVMGDNRDDSQDSRYQTTKFIPVQNIISKPFLTSDKNGIRFL